MNPLLILLYVAGGLVVLYFATKLVTYGILSARQRFADEQKKKNHQNQ